MNRNLDTQRTRGVELKDVPARVFLDTCVVNFILDYGKQIHEGQPPPAEASVRVIEDIWALYNIFLVGQRAQWELAISPHTYQEVVGTEDTHRRYYLETWFSNLWHYWRAIIQESRALPSFVEAEDLRIRVLASDTLHALPDLADRVLICDAIVYRCDLFCTRDWSTILKHRHDLVHLPLEIVTPLEWWAKISPCAPLWA